MRWLETLALGLALWSLSAAGALADKRVALVIGNGAYAQVPHLSNPVHDAEDVAAALKRLGFETMMATDLNQAGMQEAEINFARAARTADVALFYYSGHAMQFGGVNYLAPIDAQLRDEPDLRRLARADEILADLQQAKTLRILILDSCRDNPIADALKRSIGASRSASMTPGLAKMESSDGTIITYATQAGRTAGDGTGRNSPFTTAFLSHIEDKEDIAKVFHSIGASVYATTRGAQVPELSISFFGELYLNGKPPTATASIQPPAPAPAAVDPCAVANTQWKSAQATGGLAALQDHIARYPNCPPLGLAKSKVVALAAELAASPAPDTHRYDGNWLGTRTCPPAQSGTLGDKLQFIGEVKNGLFHAQYGEVGKPDSETFDGKIKTDGNALFSVKVVAAASSRSAVDGFAGYFATVRFEDTFGSGSQIATDPICSFEFAKLAEEAARPPHQ
jgi:uncharacterized caspase-like protein